MGEEFGEIIVAIATSIIMAITYKVYKYIKKESLCFLEWVENDGIYLIHNDKEENIINKNLENINKKLEQFQKSYDVLHKSKISYEQKKLQTLLTIANNDDNNNVNINVNE